MNATQIFKTYTEEDKTALKQLKEEVQARFPDRKVTLNDVISAVEPTLVTPEFLQ